MIWAAFTALSAVAAAILEASQERVDWNRARVAVANFMMRQTQSKGGSLRDDLNILCKGLSDASSGDFVCKVLDWGSGRVALTLPGGAVIKVPLNPLGLLGNQREIANYRSANTALREVFLPILASSQDGILLVQPMMDEVGGIEDELALIDRVDEASGGCLSDEQLFELAAENMGTWQGGEYVLDYEMLEGSEYMALRGFPKAPWEDYTNTALGAMGKPQGIYPHLRADRIAVELRRWLTYMLKQSPSGIEQAHIEHQVRILSEDDDPRGEGFTFLGAGSQRIVIHLGHRQGALKVAVPGQEAANLTERDLWARAVAERDIGRPGLSECLVPVLACDPAGRWLLMERTWSMDAREHVPLKMKACMERLEAAGVKDLHDGNIDYKGRVFDYAWVVAPKT